MNPRTALFVLLIACHSSVNSYGTVVGGVRTVAFTGQTVDGAPGAIGELRTPVINDAGDVAFTSRITGIHGESGIVEGLFVERGGVLELITRTGLSPPNSTAVIHSLFRPNLADNGDILVRGSFEAPNGSTNMILSSSDEALRIVAATGEAASELGNGNLFGTEFREPVFSGSGIAVFAADLLDGNNPIENPRGGPPFFPMLGRPILKDNDGELEFVVQAGDPAPFTEPGTTVGGLGTDTIVVNRTGDVAYSVALNGPNATSENFFAIYTFDGINHRMVARRGDLAPGFDSNVRLRISNNEILSINGRSEVAFTARVLPEIDGRRDAVFAEKEGQLRLVAVEGDTLLGLPEGLVVDSISSPVINDRSETAFRAFLKGTGANSSSGSSVWSEGLGGMHLIAREFEQAPGASTGETFDGFGGQYLNAIGQTVFIGTLIGPGVDSSNDTGVWAETLAGELLLVVREGDMIEVAPSDFRMVQSILLPINNGGTGNNDGRRSPINNRGDIAFWAFFDDGTSGVFISSIVAIPEPTTLALTLATIAPLLTRRQPR